MPNNTNLYAATPYNPIAETFYFESFEEFVAKSEKCRDALDLPVDEFSIEMIDGQHELFEACNISQGATLKLWFDEIEGLTETEQAELYYRCGLGDDPEEALRERGYTGYVAQQTAIGFVRGLVDEQGLLENLDESLQRYFNFESYGRDLLLDGCISEFTYDGSTYIAHGY